jgi:hypothetical protein
VYETRKQRKKDLSCEDPIFGHHFSIQETDEWVNTTDKMGQSRITNGHRQQPRRDKSKRLIHPHTLHQTHKNIHTGSHLPTHTAEQPKNNLHSNCRDNIQYMRYIHCDTVLKIWRTTWRLRDLLGDRTLNEEPLQAVLSNSKSNVEERHLLSAEVSTPTEQ